MKRRSNADVRREALIEARDEIRADILLDIPQSWTTDDGGLVMILKPSLVDPEKLLERVTKSIDTLIAKVPS